MRILIACEFSGIVRDTFLAKGHDAWSCDLLPTDIKGPHYQEDVLNVIQRERWDLMIAHPPCTHLAVSGARWFPFKRKEQQEALEFVRQLLEAPINRICLENPISVISTKIRRPDQIVQPWMFGHGETKATCLWLKNLPLLTPTNIVSGREQRIWKMPPSKDRGKLRSITYLGLAQAMAEQWGGIERMETINYCITNHRLRHIVIEIISELEDAMDTFPNFHSTHEGYAVLLEEMDELWNEIKSNKPYKFTPNMKREAIQIAAMAIRFILDRQYGTLDPS